MSSKRSLLQHCQFLAFPLYAIQTAHIPKILRGCFQVVLIDTRNFPIGFNSSVFLIIFRMPSFVLAILNIFKYSATEHSNRAVHAPVCINTSREHPRLNARAFRHCSFNARYSSTLVLFICLISFIIQLSSASSVFPFRNFHHNATIALSALSSASTTFCFFSAE